MPVIRCQSFGVRAGEGIADTIEDAPVLDADSKAVLFDRLLSCFADAAAADGFPSRVGGITGDAAHVRLIRNTDLVFVVFRDLPPATRVHVARWVTEMVVGMRKFVLLYPRGIRIQSLEEYREYCYYVAGTVGYLLTDLWHEHVQSIGASEYAVLRERSRAFAEALQTVNILKDVAPDAQRENAIYIPEQLLAAHGSSHDAVLNAARPQQTRSALMPLIQLAWADLEHAKDYLLLIPRRAIAIRMFCALPLLFAYATLRDLTRAPAPGARQTVVKISRAEVKSLTVLSVLGIMSNRALNRLAERVRRRPVVLGWTAASAGSR